MRTPSISFSFSFLSKLSEGFRIFVASSVIGSYGLVLYELFPEFLFNPNLAIGYFVIPTILISGILIGLPRFMQKGVVPTKPKETEEKSGDELLDELISQDGSQQVVQTAQTVQQDGTGVMEKNADGVELDPKAIGGPNAELEALLVGDTPSADSNTVAADKNTTVATGGLTEAQIRDMIDQKFEPVEKDLSSFKKDLSKIKEDMKITKENVDSLTESFEGTLTDMKAFQAEIANPLNFMRKYFESIDLKSLSDPSLPLKQMTGEVPTSTHALPEQPVMTPTPAVSTASNPSPNPSPNPPVAQVPVQSSQPTEMEKIESESDLDNPMDSVMKPLFSGNLSISNLMSIVELAGEMLKENGDDCIELLIEQCKLMGLKDEDENTIYNIIDMLKKSNMNVEDTLIQLYKFAKIVGITDKEADAHYAKLVAKKEQSEKPLEKSE